MKRSLILCTGLLGICACATGLPPTPSVAPLTAANNDSLTSGIAIPAAPDEITAADALVLNDLAATAPDERVVPAFDGQRVYGGTAFGELGNPNGVCDPSDPRDTAQQQPTMHAFDPVARSVPWEQNGGASSAASAVSGSPAVVFNGTLFPPSLRAFDAATGTPLQSFTFPGSVNSSPAIVGGLLVVGSGNSFNGSGSAVNAYKLP